MYVGQTRAKAYVRWSGHCSDKSGAGVSVIKSAIKKYGRSAFDFQVIDVAESIEQLNHKERFWIKKLNTLTPNGYNIEIGGSGVGSVSLETRAKISASLMGKPSKNKGRVKSAEQRATLSAALKGRKVWNKGIPASLEVRAKSSASRIGKPSSAHVAPVVRSDGVVFQKMKDAAEAIGVHRSSILDVIKGRRNSVRGFTFRYAGDEA